MVIYNLYFDVLVCFYFGITSVCFFLHFLEWMLGLILSFTKCLEIFKNSLLLNVAHIYLCYKLKVSAKLKKMPQTFPLRFLGFCALCKKEFPTSI